jgi:hypothetical protein
MALKWKRNLNVLYFELKKSDFPGRYGFPFVRTLERDKDGVI